MAGCGDPDKNAGTGSPGAPLTPPTVIFVTPSGRLYWRLPQHRRCHRNLQQAHESCNDQHHDLHLSWHRRDEPCPEQLPTMQRPRLPPLHPRPLSAPNTLYTATITTRCARPVRQWAGDQFRVDVHDLPYVHASARRAIPLGAAGLRFRNFGRLHGHQRHRHATTVSGDVGVWPGTRRSLDFRREHLTGAFHAGDAMGCHDGPG